MKKLAWASIGLVFALVVSGCSGKDGAIYGQYYNTDAIDLLSLGGFPEGYIQAYSNYRIEPGTYQTYYRLVDGVGNRYPGVGLTWSTIYTVEADEGLLYADGADRYFELFLSRHGMTKYGAVKSIAAQEKGVEGQDPVLGAISWAQDGLRITVKNEIVATTEAQEAALQANIR